MRADDVTAFFTVLSNEFKKKSKIDLALVINSRDGSS